MNDRQPKLSGIIPAYDPDPRILRKLIEALRANGFDELIVVDDGSDGASAPLFAELARIDCVTVLRHAINLGKGAALKTAFNELLTRDGERITITLDADGQHTVEDVARVAAAATEYPDELILGCRVGTAPVPLRSRLGNALTRLVFRLVTGQAIRDTQTGLRAWPRALLHEALRSNRSGYEFESETLLNALRGGARWREVEIDRVYYDDNASSHFNPVRDSLLIYAVIFRFALGSLTIATTDYLLFLLAYAQTAEIATSIVISRTVATLLAFFVARDLVFRDPTRRDFQQVFEFVTLVVVLGGISIVLMNVMTIRLGIPVVLAKALAEGSLWGVSFIMQRQLFFTRPSADTDWDAYYENPFPASRWTRAITTKKLIRAMRKNIDGKPVSTIVELGGGGSCVASALCDAFDPATYRIYDDNHRGLARVADLGLPQTECHHADLTEEIRWRGDADIVVSIGLIEHFAPSGTAHVFATHFEAARPGGLVVVTYPTPTWLYLIIRRAAELLGLWRFGDERPLRIKEIEQVIASRGQLLHWETNWLTGLTQQLVVARKSVEGVGTGTTLTKSERQR